MNYDMHFFIVPVPSLCCLLFFFLHFVPRSWGVFSLLKHPKNDDDDGGDFGAFDSV